MLESIKLKKFKELYNSYLKKVELAEQDFTVVNPKHITNQIIKLISKKDFEKVKKIFEHSKYKNHIDIHKDNDIILSEACKVGDINFIKYLILEKGADIYGQKGAIFANLIVWRHLEVIDYLIFEYKIKETPEIIGIIKMLSADNVNKMFQSRNLSELLEKKNIIEKKNKV